VSPYRTRRVLEHLRSRGALPKLEGEARPVVQVLQDARVKRLALVRILSDAPQVLTLGANATRAKLEFLSSMGVRDSAMGEMLEKCPRLLLAPVYQVGCVVSFLHELGISWRLMPFILERFPSVFLHPPSHSLQPLAAWMADDLRLGATGARAVIEGWPQVLTYTPVELQAKCAGLQAAGLCQDTLSSMVAASPDILSLDLELQALPTLHFLQASGLSKAEVSSMLAAEPRIIWLNFSSASEQKKLQFLQNVLGREVADLAECPAYALMRLGKVAPRAAFLRQQGRELREVPLAELTHNTDRDWAREVARVPVNRFNRFKEEYMDAEAEAEAEGLTAGGWDYFHQSSMP